MAPAPWLRIGGGFSYIASTRGRLGLTGSIPATSAADSELFHTVDADVVAVYYPQFGVQIEPIRGLPVSAVYRGAFRFRLDIAAQDRRAARSEFALDRTGEGANRRQCASAEE